MSEDRKMWVGHVFKRIDADGDGVADIGEVEAKYNAKAHPTVQAGKCSEEVALNEFLRNFRNHHEFLMGKGKDPRVTLDEFEEYYHYISAYVDNDDYFGYLISSTWKPKEGAATQEIRKEYEVPRTEQPYEPRAKAMQEPKESYAHEKVYEPKTIVEPGKMHRREEEMKASYQKAAGSIKGRGELKKGNLSSEDNPLKSRSEMSSSARIRRLPELENFRKILAIRGPRGILGLAQQFRNVDSKNTGEIDINEFNYIIKNFNVPISEKDIRAVFEAYDRSGKWKINYNEFLMHVKGATNPFRKKLVEMAFDTLDKQGAGIVSVEDVMGAYSPLDHPLVRLKKKTEEQVLKEFIETFKMSKDLYGGESEMTVSKEEFFDYYNIVSASIESDREFEQIVVNTWQLHKNHKEMPAPYLSKPGVKGSQGAPFGTTAEPTDYSRPESRKDNSGSTAAGYKLGSKAESAYKKFPLTGSEQQVVNSFRQKLVPRGVKGILLFKKALVMADGEKNGTVGFGKLQQVLKESRFKYDETDAEKLFKAFDKERAGRISYDMFVRVAVVYFICESRVTCILLAYLWFCRHFKLLIRARQDN
eukprot:TRINITY_DN4066_c0_g1_i4.p1 TRINITY_DN4066_c0_g1~~TRINITY_DN4066_c0_g1_i4.p1  ORF type:complete len:588 (-),score=139.90 TRINITY_DN4066_c0_g1_i4:411-2174(-)